MSFWFIFVVPVIIPWNFAVIGDTQSNWWVARRAVKQMQAKNVEFVINVGDIWGCASPYRWKRIKKIFSFTKSYWVIGNHELKKCGGKYIPWKYRPLWERYFRSINEDTHTSFTHRSWKFFLLDSATPIMRYYQLYWFEREIKNSTRALLFSHRALPCRTCKRWNWRKLDPMPFRFRNRQFWRMLQKYKRKIGGIFFGHWHGFYPAKKEGLKMWGSGGGGGYLAPRQKYHWLLVTVWGKHIFVNKVDIK